MDATNSATIDPVAIVRQLDANAIRDRIDEIEHERDALMLLLRAAKRAKPEPSTKKAVPA